MSKRRKRLTQEEILQMFSEDDDKTYEPRSLEGKSSSDEHEIEPNVPTFQLKTSLDLDTPSTSNFSQPVQHSSISTVQQSSILTLNTPVPLRSVKKKKSKVPDPAITSLQYFRHMMMNDDMDETSAACFSNLSSSSTILCEHCGCSFSANKNLYRHIRQKHPTVSLQIGSQECPLCDSKVSGTSALKSHILENHPDINLCFEKNTFYCKEEFECWKNALETNSQCQYVISVISRLADDRTVKYYSCHRSGKPRLQAKRVRSMKSSGSNKIGKLCPAYLKVYECLENEICEIEVIHQTLHLGHDLDIGKTNLSKFQRVQLASQLNQGIPKSRVLTNLRNFSPSNRLSYTKMKDLNNISRDFAIDKVTLDSNDVDIRVKKLQDEKSNPILLDKPVGQDSLLYADNQRQKLLSMFRQILIKCDSTEQFQVLHDSLKTVEAKLDVMSQEISTPHIPVDLQEVPVNKTVKPQIIRFTKSKTVSWESSTL